jgi:hypothetical protein
LKFESLSGAEPQTIARLQEAFGKSGGRGFWRPRLEDYREAANRDTSMLEWWPKRARELGKEIVLLNGWRKAFKIVAI